MYTTTLKELGPRLPIGQIGGNGLVKTFELRPFTTRIDRRLAIWHESVINRYTPGQYIACHVAKLLSMLVSKIGKHQFAVDENGDSSAESELNVHKWFYADVFYAYLYARVQTLGKELLTSVSCPNSSCGYRTDSAIFDLETIDVRVAEKVDELGCWIDLKQPFVLRDGSTLLKSAKLSPIKWSTMAKPGVIGSSIGEVDLISLQDSISAINASDQPYQCIPGELDNMTRLDFVRINRQAGNITAGPDLRTRIDCPKCGTPILNPLNWSYDYFFGASLPLGVT